MQIAAIQTLITLCLGAGLRSLFDLGIELIWRGDVVWLVLHGLVTTVWVPGFVASASFAVRAALQRQRAIETFARLFWLYYVADLMWLLMMVRAIMRVPALAGGLPLFLAVAALLPLYQRRLARALLAESQATTAIDRAKGQSAS